MWFTKPSDREQEHKRIVLQNLGPLAPEQADRIDSLFDSIEPTDHARRIIALADTPEMASDLWELARLRDMWRS